MPRTTAGPSCWLAATVPWSSPAELSRLLSASCRACSVRMLSWSTWPACSRSGPPPTKRCAPRWPHAPGPAMPCGRCSPTSRHALTRPRRSGLLAATSGAVPLVLTGPGTWPVAGGGRAAGTGSDPGQPDAAQAETAAMYSADFLRMFAGAGVDGLLLDDGPVPVDELIHPEAYRPVLNIADHYEWPVLVRTDAAAAWPHGPVPGIAAAGSGPGRARRSVRPLGGRGWLGLLGRRTDPPAEADLVLAAVPAAGRPGSRDEAGPRPGLIGPAALDVSVDEEEPAMISTDDIADQPPGFAGQKLAGRVALVTGRHPRDRRRDLRQPGQPGSRRGRRIQRQHRARQGICRRLRAPFGHFGATDAAPGKCRCSRGLPAGGAGSDRPARPAGHPGQQRRHHAGQARPGPDDGRLGQGDEASTCPARSTWPRPRSGTCLSAALAGSSTCRRSSERSATSGRPTTLPRSPGCSG